MIRQHDLVVKKDYPNTVNGRVWSISSMGTAVVGWSDNRVTTHRLSDLTVFTDGEEYQYHRHPLIDWLLEGVANAVDHLEFMYYRRK